MQAQLPDRTATDGERRHPLFALAEADLDFVLRMILASGSLKEVARAYGVSYPTIRSRLDALIARLSAIVANKPVDPMTDLVADLVEQGELTAGAARRILKLSREVRQREQGA